jgi:hypothetical protein
MSGEGYGPTGFHPDDLDGHMHDKKYYLGDLFPDDENYDYKNNAKLHKKVHTIADNMGRDGFIKVDKSKIKKADQSQFHDKGEVRKPVPSKTFSGHAKKKYGKRGV